MSETTMIVVSVVGTGIGAPTYWASCSAYWPGT